MSSFSEARTGCDTPSFGAFVVSLDFELHWGVRDRVNRDGECMAQMDPGATKRSSSAQDFQDYAAYKSAGDRTASSRNDGGPPAPATIWSPTIAPLIQALQQAADQTATAIAHGTKQARVEVRERLNEVIGWLVTGLRSNGQDPAPVPPARVRTVRARARSLGH